MKPFRLLLAFSLLLLAACNKKDEVQSAQPYDQAIIGKEYGFSGMSKYFLINSQGVFPKTGVNSGGWQFDSVSLPAGKQAIALGIINDIPSFLYSHPNTSFICPNCSDQSFLHLEITRNGVVTKWDLDIDEAYLPKELKAFTEEMSQSLEQL